LWSLPGKPRAVCVSSSSSGLEVLQTSSLELLNTLSLSDSLSSYSSWLLPVALVDLGCAWPVAARLAKRSCLDRLASSLRTCSPVVIISSRSFREAREDDDGWEVISIHESALDEYMSLRHCKNAYLQTEISLYFDATVLACSAGPAVLSVAYRAYPSQKARGCEYLVAWRRCLRRPLGISQSLRCSLVQAGSLDRKRGVLIKLREMPCPVVPYTCDVVRGDACDFRFSESGLTAVKIVAGYGRWSATISPIDVG